MKYCSFDLEIAKQIPEGEDWDKYRPFGISCAATVCTGDARPTLWFNDHYSVPENSHFGPQMTPDGCCELVEYLAIQLDRGFVPLGWNSLRFDSHVLAEESGMWKESAELALGHVDMMFQVVCTVGHRLGLEKALRGMGLAGKTEGMSGALAPVLWAQGQYQKVLDYVANDVIQPLKLAEVVEKEGWLRWISNSGRGVAMPVSRWLTVKECLALPLPDTSWMLHAERREDYLAWMPREVLVHAGYYRHWLVWGDRRWGPYLVEGRALEMKQEMEFEGAGPFTLVEDEIVSSH